MALAVAIRESGHGINLREGEHEKVALRKDLRDGHPGRKDQ